MPNVGMRQIFLANDIIFREGEEGNCAYIIEEGRIQISVRRDGEEVIITSLGIGEIFGEMSIIDGQARSATAMALEPCKLSVVTKEQLTKRLHESDSIVKLLISILLTRIRSNNKNQIQLSHNYLSQDPLVSQQEAIDKIRFESELFQALRNNEFVLYYQPIMDLRYRTLVGFEALIRWNSPTRGFVRPDLFMPTVEETSLCTPVGQWIQAQATKDLSKMIQNANGDLAQKLFLSVNISGREFENADFVNYLESVRSKNNISSKQIKLEITERIFMQGPITEDNMNKCRELGYQISLDDFGTGYSSLSYLSKFNVDNLKIDRSFVMKITKEAKSKAIAQAIISISRALNLSVIAEGIETESENLHLVALGCEFGQGYLFGKPMPLDAALEFIRKFNISKAA